LLVCKASSQSEFAAFKKMMKAKKYERNLKRQEAKQILKPEAYEVLCDTLKAESIGHQLQLKRLKKDWDGKIESAEMVLNKLLEPIDQLKDERAALSASLQKQLHEQYQFLNYKSKIKDLLAIFKNTASPIPLAGSG